MSEKIKIQEILDKYQKVFYEDMPQSTGVAIEIDDVRSIIKEVSEKIVDKCSVESERFANRDIKQDIKQSIDNVKTMIIYD